MNVLGRFQYHIYEVTLTSSDDEREYQVTTFEGNLRNKKGERVVHPFDSLSQARQAFENAVHNVVFKTSFTDVSLYMQHK